MAKGRYHEWLEADGLTKLEAWARDGLTEQQIATNMGICWDTLHVWKQRFPEILRALKKGKEVVDIQVENALLKRAMGYTSVEIIRERVGSELVVVKEITKEVPPDTTAQIFWLKNRRPDAWRDKRDLSAQIEAKNPFAGLSTEELRQLIRHD